MLLSEIMSPMLLYFFLDFVTVGIVSSSLIFSSFSSFSFSLNFSLVSSKTCDVGDTALE